MTRDGQGRETLGYQCVDPEQGSRLYLLDSKLLPDWERQDLEDHIGICHHCRAIRNLETAVAVELAARDQAPPVLRLRSWNRPLTLLSGAALLLVAILASLLWPEPSISRSPSAGFIANHGQVGAEVRFFTPGSMSTAFFTDDSIVFDLRLADQDSLLIKEYRHVRSMFHPDLPIRGAVLRVRFAMAKASPRIHGAEGMNTRYHYYKGKDPSAWSRNVPAYRELHYDELWPSAGLIFREQGGRLVYELTGDRDPSTLAFSYEGADSVVERSDGSLAVHSAAGVLVDRRPRHPGDTGFFAWERERLDLAVLPSGEDGLIWSSFLGGHEMQAAAALDLADNDEVLVGGFTAKLFYPEQSGYYDLSHSMDPYDAFVARLSADGRRMIWQATLGGSGHQDVVHKLKVDGDGSVVLTGVTSSFDFPMYAAAFDAEPEPGDPSRMRDVFVLRLAAAGDRLLGGSFLGGDHRDGANALELAANGDVILGGFTLSSDFPCTDGAYDTRGAARGDRLADIVACRFNYDCSALLWSTFVAGGGHETANCIALDAQENVYLAGITSSRDFPTTEGAFRRVYTGGNFDAFICKLAADGSALLWSTYLGGSGNWDVIDGLRCDARGNLVVAGSAYSADFPTTAGAYDTSYNTAGGRDGNDIVMAKFTGGEGAMVWSSFLGGLSTELAQAMVLDAAGNLVVAGHTASRDFPAAGGFDGDHNGGSFDAVLARFSPDGRRLLGATYLGGAGDDWCWGLALDRRGNAVLVGLSSSLDYPVSEDAYDPMHNGSIFDSFVTKLALPGGPEF